MHWVNLEPPSSLPSHRLQCDETEPQHGAMKHLCECTDRCGGGHRAYASRVTCTPRLATLQDVSSWLELVPEVEDLLGPMPDFEVHVRRGIKRGTALVMVDSGQVQGAGP